MYSATALGDDGDPISVRAATTSSRFVVAGPREPLASVDIAGAESGRWRPCARVRLRIRRAVRRIASAWSSRAKAPSRSPTAARSAARLDSSAASASSCPWLPTSDSVMLATVHNFHALHNYS